MRKTDKREPSGGDGKPSGGDKKEAGGAGEASGGEGDRYETSTAERCRDSRQNESSSAAGRTLGRTIAYAAFFAVAALVFASASAAAYPTTSFESPDLAPNVQGENVVEPGDTVTLQVAVQDRGSAAGRTSVQPADLSGIRAIDDPRQAIGTVARFSDRRGPFEIRSGTQKLGSVSPKRPGQLQVTVEVDEDAEPGTYSIPVEFEYEYVARASSDGGGARGAYRVVRHDESESESIEVRVEETVELDVVELQGEGLRAGDDGEIHARVTNSGSEKARDARLRFVDSPPFQARDGTKYLGDLETGEEASADFRVSVGRSYVSGEAAAKLALEYEDENGATRRTDVETGGVSVAGDAEFSVEAEGEETYVDSVGAVHVELTNEGDTKVEDARFVLHENPPFQPVSRRASVGDLEPGESKEASFRVEIGDRAVSQTYPVVGHVEYQDEFDETRSSSAVTGSVDVGPERDIQVRGSPAVAAGATKTVEFEVENTGDGAMQDAVARINVDTPLSTSDDTAYVGDLEGGESANVSFRVSVDGDATPKNYSVDVVAKYDNAFGDKVVTDVRKAPVEVEESGGVIASILGLFR